MSKNEVFTLDDLRNCYISLRKVWEPLAHRAIDNLMLNFDKCSRCGHTASIVGGYVTALDKVSLTNKRAGLKRPLLRCERPGCRHLEPAPNSTVQEVGDYLWEQDAGFDTFDNAIEALAKKQGKVPDGKTDWVGEAYEHFTKAWNKAQDRYLKERYGIDESNLA